MHGTTARGNGSASFYLCDFDGTVARADVGNRFFATFIAARAEWDALIDAWIAETMGGREIMAKECALARVDHSAAVAFALAHAELDPGFAAFVDAARAAGGDVAIASDGLLTYIRPILDRNGLAHVEASANDAVFEGDRLRPVFGTPDGEGCGQCGSCKRAVLVVRSRGFGRTVFVGDGLSDRCGAAAADVVYAKGDLLEWCARQGIAARPFQTFADVARGEGLVLSRETTL
jgi:2-hydroxy-3-keto-5-methylthiopentenyl-1-phosphate phosphatase